MGAARMGGEAGEGRGRHGSGGLHAHRAGVDHGAGARQGAAASLERPELDSRARSRRAKIGRVQWIADQERDQRGLPRFQIFDGGTGRAAGAVYRVLGILEVCFVERGCDAIYVPIATVLPFRAPKYEVSPADALEGGIDRIEMGEGCSLMRRGDVAATT